MTVFADASKLQFKKEGIFNFSVLVVVVVAVFVLSVSERKSLMFNLLEVNVKFPFNS